MKRRIAISAGHSNLQGKDRGAVSQWMVEGVETVKLRDLVVERFKKLNQKVNTDPNSNVTYQTVALFKKYFDANDIVLDIHFNASTNPNASGTEVIVPNDATNIELAIATELSSNISTLLIIPNRGVISEKNTPRKKLLWMTIPSINILLEVCFLSNERDCMVYELQKERVADTIVDVLLKFKGQ